MRPDDIFPRLQRDITFRFYVTAYVDLLGLSNRLLQVENLFRDDLHESDQLALVRASVGEIYRLRQGFEAFYLAEGASDIRSVLPVQDFETESLLASISGRLSRTTFQYVSDCVIISVPVDMHDKAGTLAAISRLVSSCASASMSLFCYKQLCRGGIELGVSAEPFPGEILGASLVAAHRLESVVAKYPRIVVGQLAREFLLRVAASRDRSRAAQFAARIAAITLRLLQEDGDGEWYIDFLRRDHVATVSDLGLKAQFAAAKRFVNDERRRSSQDPALREKYEWLERYLNQAGL